MSESMSAVEAVTLTAADLLRLGFEEDKLLLEDVSLCTLCTNTCDITRVTQ